MPGGNSMIITREQIDEVDIICNNTAFLATP